MRATKTEKCNDACNDLFKTDHEPTALRKKAMQLAEKERLRVSKMRQELVRVNSKTVIIKYHAQ